MKIQIYNIMTCDIVTYCLLSLSTVSVSNANVYVHVKAMTVEGKLVEGLRPKNTWKEN